MPPANEVSDPNYKPLSKPVFVNNILTQESKLQLKALLKQINIALAKLGDEQQPVEAPTEPVELTELPVTEDVTITVKVNDLDPETEADSDKKDEVSESVNDSIYEETGIKVEDSNSNEGVILKIVIGIIILINLFLLFKIFIK